MDVRYDIRIMAAVSYDIFVIVRSLDFGNMA